MTTPANPKSPQEIIEFVKSIIHSIVDDPSVVQIDGTTLPGELIVIVRAPYAEVGKILGKNKSMKDAIMTVVIPVCRRNGYYFQFQVRNDKNEIQSDGVTDEQEKLRPIRSRYNRDHSNGRPFKRGAPTG